jgi:AmmeMemoRadiSam system protein B
MVRLPVRPPAVAGQFYPSDPGALRLEIKQYVEAAKLPRGLGTVRAVIAPHAGYVYSGPTAGFAFRALTTLPKKKWTVFLMGPAHRVAFAGVALGGYSAFRTPLGDAPVAVERIGAMLLRSTLYTREAGAHANEHSLEVEVPFLQMVLPEFELVPMLFGEVDPRKVGADLSIHIGEDDLIVVSSDLSHYLPYATAQEVDQALLKKLTADDETGVLLGEACGKAPAAALMGVARQRIWTPHLLDYRTSGDTAGDKQQVVGYASVAYAA